MCCYEIEFHINSNKLLATLGSKFSFPIFYYSYTAPFSILGRLSKRAVLSGNVFSSNVERRCSRRIMAVHQDAEHLRITSLCERASEQTLGLGDNSVLGCSLGLQPCNSLNKRSYPRVWKNGAAQRPSVLSGNILGRLSKPGGNNRVYKSHSKRWPPDRP